MNISAYLFKCLIFSNKAFKQKQAMSLVKVHVKVPGMAKNKPKIDYNVIDVNQTFSNCHICLGIWDLNWDII